jgi:type IV secretion system protein VirB4
MLKLGEYRQKADRIADHLPWAALVAPGIVMNKDGSFQRSFRFRGPDLESATQSELVAVCARINNVMRRFGSGWAIFFEADRQPAPGYPASEFPDDATWLLDEERRAQFEGGGVVEEAGRRAVRQHFETDFYLTLLFMPPADKVASAERVLIETPDANPKRDWRYELASFQAETDRAFDLLGQVLAEIRPLDDTGILTYLHGTISTKRHTVHAPETPMYLDALLADTSLRGGLDPVLGDHHLRCVTILGFPGATQPGILDALNHLEFPYRWTTRFIALDKTRATKSLTTQRRQWFNKRKSVLQF